ncbi:MAG: phosphatidylglycerophosphatase A [Opitutales bacterium]|nr:phosphatidylglycerophosphatase A [Opitutales bacterium]
MNVHRYGWGWTRLLSDRSVQNLVTCGPVGYWGKAPGTNGSVVGIVFYTLFFYQAPVFTHVMAGLFLVWLASALCDEGERRLQKRDPGEIILDEIIAVPLCFVGVHFWMNQTGYVWLYLLAGFLLFRLFDIMKPFGIRKLQSWPGGWGVVVDDVAAAAATAACLHLGGYLAVHFL